MRSPRARSTGPITQYSLSLGDDTAYVPHEVNGAGDIPNQSHWSAAGVYHPTLTVSDGFRTSSATVTLVVTPPVPRRRTQVTTRRSPRATRSTSTRRPASAPPETTRTTGSSATERATGATVSHVYTAKGSYSARVTVDVGNGATVTDTTVITVEKAPDRHDGGLVATCTTTPAAPVSGASVVIELSDGSRRTAVTSAGGVARFANLADGSYEVFATIDSRLADGSATVRDGSGTVNLVVRNSPFGVASLDTKILTHDEIIAAGIDPNTPGNNRITSFTVAVAFSPEIPGGFCGLVNADGGALSVRQQEHVFHVVVVLRHLRNHGWSRRRRGHWPGRLLRDGGRRSRRR